MEKLLLDVAKPVEIGHLRVCLGSLGCTPSDRSRVSAQLNHPSDKSDPLSLLLGT